VGGDIAVRVTHEELARFDRHAGRTQSMTEGVPQAPLSTVLSAGLGRNLKLGETATESPLNIIDPAGSVFASLLDCLWCEIGVKLHQFPFEEG
jgi:hypothetical protein